MSRMNTKEYHSLINKIIIYAGPCMFAIGTLAYSINVITASNLAKSELLRTESERDTFLGQKVKRKNEEDLRARQAQMRLEESLKKTHESYIDLPSVLRSQNDFTVVNLGDVSGGGAAVYSYSYSIGQRRYNVQGSLKLAEGNRLIYEDNSSKTDSDVLSSGEVKYSRDISNDILTLTFITSNNIGSVARLGDIKVFRLLTK